MPLGLDPLGTFSVFATVVPNPPRSEAGLGRVMPRLLGFGPAGRPFRSTGATPPRRPDWKSELRAAPTSRPLLPWACSSFGFCGSPDPGRHFVLLAAHPLLGFDFAAVGALRNGICGCHRFRRRREGALQRFGESRRPADPAMFSPGPAYPYEVSHRPRNAHRTFELPSPNGPAAVSGVTYSVVRSF